MESRRSSSRSGSGINGSGGRLRRQRSSEWREYSTSEEEATARQTAVYAAGIASLLANYTNQTVCRGISKSTNLTHPCSRTKLYSGFGPLSDNESCSVPSPSHTVDDFHSLQVIERVIQGGGSALILGRTRKN
ncbi:unnamed protein product [Nesidiocoris tenuis]|uniref:Uncharacterized protein n=1 Tax=Nesidiocoris tenuis TaxID=355587 RepID=A0A6H5G379_9HEMI|nr:unnamed protein product [Nesidiocoris tenuis]